MHRPTLLQLLDTAGVAFVVCAPCGTPEYTSTAAEQLLGPCHASAPLWSHVRAWAAQLGAAQRARPAGAEPALHVGELQAVGTTLHVSGALVGPAPSRFLVVLRLGRPFDSPLLQRLTPREQQVAQLIAAGHRAPHIAAALGLSVHTVRRHTEQIFHKCHVRTRARLAALLHGAVGAPDAGS